MPDNAVEEVRRQVVKPAVKPQPAPFNLEEGDDLASTVVSTMEDLERVAPKVYKALMESIATMITGEMRSSQERIKKRMREVY